MQILNKIFSKGHPTPLHVVPSGMLLEVYTRHVVMLLGTGLGSVQYYSSACSGVGGGQSSYNLPAL